MSNPLHGCLVFVATREPLGPSRIEAVEAPRREIMSFGKGALLWLIGIPLPIILLLALFWR
jgi:hypothetical protein